MMKRLATVSCSQEANIVIELFQFRGLLMVWDLMSGTLERAVEWGYLEANPGRRIKVPAMQRRRKTVVLTREQLATLLLSLQEPVKMFAVTVAMTGLRIGEVLALRWRNVDFERSLIHVREAVYEGNLSSPKSRSSIRDIPIGPTLQQSLQECRKDALADAFVFASRNGTPLDSHNQARMQAGGLAVSLLA